MMVYTEINPKGLKFCVLNTERRLPGLAKLSVLKPMMFSFGAKALDLV